MKKLLAILLCVLLLSGCKPNGTHPTKPVGDPPSSSSATEDTTEQTTEGSTEEVVQEPPYYENWDAYLYDNSVYPIIYNAETEYDRLGAYIDKETMVSGYFYSINVDTEDIYLITEKAVVVYMQTSEHIYYVLEEEPRKVYRTDETGADLTVVYESTYGDVTYIDYYGTDASGILLAAEDNKRIVSYDIPTGAVTVLMEAYYIESFYYTPYSVVHDNVYKYICSKELGPTIFWSGKARENDPDKPDGDPTPYAYYYFVSTETHWSVSDWRPVT